MKSLPPEKDLSSLDVAVDLELQKTEAINVTPNVNFKIIKEKDNIELEQFKSRCVLLIIFVVLISCLIYLIYNTETSEKNKYDKEIQSLSVLKESIDKNFTSQVDYKNINNQYLISEKLIPVNSYIFSQNNEIRNQFKNLVLVNSSENHKQYKITYLNMYKDCNRLIKESALLFNSILINAVVVKDTNTPLNEENVAAKCHVNRINDITFVSASK